MLDPPAFFAPWSRGQYRTAPDLKPLGYEFGNGVADSKLILTDTDFARYRQNKLACMAESPEKYFACHDLSKEVCQAAVLAIADRLSGDYPDQFARSELALRCDLTGEEIPLSDAGEPETLAALAMQIQPDVAIVRLDSGRDWNAALHLCSPSHWAAGDKIGRSFFDTHVPVPGFETANSAANKLVEMIVNRGPFVRFVWGVESDDRLNHHPIPPPGWEAEVWKGRQFAQRRYWARLERQTLWPLPAVSAALFFIHVQTVPDTLIRANPALRRSLLAGIRSMSPYQREYKGLAAQFSELEALLQC